MPSPNLKVKDEDNIFLKSMELMVIIATKDNNKGHTVSIPFQMLNMQGGV
jgi:hypothetical protein